MILRDDEDCLFSACDMLVVSAGLQNLTHHISSAVVSVSFGAVL